MNILINQDNCDVAFTFERDQEYVFQFDDALSVEQIVDVLVKLCEVEESFYEQNECLALVTYDLKSVAPEKLTRIIKALMHRETLINTSLILNIGLLIKGYNTLDDSMFESPSVYVKDLEQLLDLKLDLMDDIKAIQTELTKWYLACLKSAYKVEYTYLDDVAKIPMLYKRILSTSDVLTLSQIMAKSGNVSTDDLPLVENAYPIVAEIVSCSSMANQLLELLTTAE